MLCFVKIYSLYTNVHLIAFYSHASPSSHFIQTLYVTLSKSFEETTMIKQLNYDKHDRATSLIREVVATYIRNEANTNPLITVTSVSVSPDYRKYTVFFTTIPDGREDDALIFLKRSASDIRSYVKKHTKLKIIPHLEFAVDYGERHRQHIDEIAADIDEQEGVTQEEVIERLLDAGSKKPDTEEKDN